MHPSSFCFHCWYVWSQPEASHNRPITWNWKWSDSRQTTNKQISPLLPRGFRRRLIFPTEILASVFLAEAALWRIALSSLVFHSMPIIVYCASCSFSQFQFKFGRCRMPFDATMVSSIMMNVKMNPQEYYPTSWSHDQARHCIAFLPFFLLSSTNLYFL